jgi:hypothetical protein
MKTGVPERGPWKISLRREEYLITLVSRPDSAGFQARTVGTPREEDTRGEVDFMRHIQSTLLFAAIILGMPLLPLLAQNAGGRSAAATAPPMAMMEQCQKSCDAISATMAELDRTLAGARSSKDVATLQAVLDYAQSSVSRMEAQHKDCAAMMEQMSQARPGPASH